MELQVDVFGWPSRQTLTQASMSPVKPRGRVAFKTHTFPRSQCERFRTGPADTTETKLWTRLAKDSKK